MTNRLSNRDLLQLGIGLLFALTAFLPWYSTDANNLNSTIDGHRGDLSPWDVHPVLRWILLFAAAAALLSAWQTWHAHQTQWKRGEMSAVVATTLAGLVLVAGWISRPGDPAGTISLKYGWLIALVLAVAAVANALARMPPARRRPPGV